MASARQSEVLDEYDIASGSLRRLFTTWAQCCHSLRVERVRDDRLRVDRLRGDAPPEAMARSPFARVDAIAFSARIERMALEDRTCLAVFPMPPVDHPNAIERFRSDLCTICGETNTGLQPDRPSAAEQKVQTLDAAEIPPLDRRSSINSELFSLNLLGLYVRSLCSDGRPFVGRFESTDPDGQHHRQEHLVLPLSRCGTLVDTVFVAATHRENLTPSRESSCQDTIKLGRKNVRLTREVMQ